MSSSADDGATTAESATHSTRTVVPRRVRWLFVICVAGAVFYFSVINTPPSIATSTATGWSVLSTLPGFDRLEKHHAVAYAGLAYTLAFTIRDWSRPRWQRAIFIITVASLYGLGIEIMQFYTPGRVFEIRDLISNTLGACLIIPWYLLMQWWEIRQRDHPTLS
jgi:VanZ family protein